MTAHRAPPLRRRENRLVEASIDSKADTARRLAHESGDGADIDGPAPCRRPVLGVVRGCARRTRCLGPLGRRRTCRRLEPEPFPRTDDVVRADAVPASHVPIVEAVAPGNGIERIAGPDDVLLGRVRPAIVTCAGCDREDRGEDEPSLQVTPPRSGTKLT